MEGSAASEVDVVAMAHSIPPVSTPDYSQFFECQDTADTVDHRLPW